ncbi:hypothetical protein JOD55_001382 [Arcanobacterium pluranimalium]|uniref:DUF3052 family protein n=1 Tax=Arcanobacterium pluranimalium TaxID=108028 RepID=UPI003083FF52|nr:hypothetical protein [Arcanobacterium pluranimalium]
MSGTTTGEKLGFKLGDVVQEFGYDDDVDFDLRDSIENITGQQLEDEDYRGAADSVLAWWRSDDGNVDDLTDYLVDCAASLDSGAGAIWCLVPVVSSEFHVATADVAEAAKTAGLSVPSSVALGGDWTAYRIVSRGH